MGKILMSILAGLFLISVSAYGQHKYVGIKMCKICHQLPKWGNQYGVWSKSKHAEAYKVLTEAKAAEIAKGKGLKTAANKSPECLGCHAITADPKLTPDGVQCETCHGPGSDYKSLTVMQDKAKAIAAGLAEFKDKAAIEKLCKTCHNEKSPTFKGFKFEEMWAKIKHPTPKG
jgi:DnaJ-class molecular chaperone